MSGSAREQASAGDDSGTWSLARLDGASGHRYVRAGGPCGPVARARAARHRRGGALFGPSGQRGPGHPHRSSDYHGVDKDGKGIGEPVGKAWGTLNLWEWALRYVEAEQLQDPDRLAELDGVVAMLYAAGGRHFPEAAKEEMS